MDMFGGADFRFEVIAGVVVIYDLNQGGRSVTNDVENVLRVIGESVPLEGKKIIYQDSSGIFDGINLTGQRFYSVNKKTLGEALKAIGATIN